jgi:type IV pilus biogenesis protein CpaD/CtpE
MIRKHPNVSDANFDILIDIAIKDAELGMSQRHAQAIRVYIGNTYGHSAKKLNLKVSFPV